MGAWTEPADTSPSARRPRTSWWLRGRWNVRFSADYIARQFTPVPKRGQAHAHVEVPLQALIPLRNMMRRLAHRLKKATARNEAELALIRARYGNIFMLANSLSQQDLALATASVVRRAPQPALAAPAHVEQGRRQPRGQEQPQAKSRNEPSTHTLLESTWRYARWKDTSSGSPGMQPNGSYHLFLPNRPSRSFGPMAQQDEKASVRRSNASAGTAGSQCWTHNHSLQAGRQATLVPCPARDAEFSMGRKHAPRRSECECCDTL